MAKKNGRDDPPKPQVAENEQMSDIILILDKMELILQAVSQIDKDGRYKTVPAEAPEVEFPGLKDWQRRCESMRLTAFTVFSMVPAIIFWITCSATMHPLRIF